MCRYLRREAWFAYCLYGSSLFLPACTDNRQPIHSSAEERLQPATVSVRDVRGQSADAGISFTSRGRALTAAPTR
jgi:hypothetical protein